MDKQKSAIDSLMRALGRRGDKPSKPQSAQHLTSFLAKARLDRADAVREALSQHESATRTS